MVRSLLLRLPFLRPLLPRLQAPLLPFVRVRHPAYLTLTPRTHPSLLRRSFSTPGHPPTSPKPDQEPSNQPLSQKLKHLIKTYGWYALGVYFAIGIVDFGVAFAGLNLFGAEHVSRLAAAAKEAVTNFIHNKVPEPGREETESVQPQTGTEGLYAMLVLAYTVHKTVFLPVRIGFTAAFTPKLVRWLSRRGWAGAAGSKRAATELKERVSKHSRSGD